MSSHPTQPIRLLACSDWCDSGFGRVMKELLPRLARTGLFEIQMVAWAYDGDPDVYDEARLQGVRLHAAYGPWGAKAVERIAARMCPDVLFTLGDPWMVDWVGRIAGRERFRWVMYTPIDRDPVSRSWLDMLARPDCLVLYSDWGAEVVRRQMPFRAPVVIPHGVDPRVFHPFDPAKRAAARRVLGIAGDAFVVGQVARNQERKQVPRTIAAFKAWNCACTERGKGLLPGAAYSCPRCGEFKQDPEKASSLLYLHMTMGDDEDDGRGVSWNIHELVRRYDLGGRVLGTPGYTVRKGLASRDLNAIYNLFDVHMLTTKREGWGLSVSEAMAAGVPNIVTGYSACRELVEKGGGELIDVLAYVNEPHDEAEGAIVDVGSAADKLERLFRDPALREAHAKTGRAFAESLDWDLLVPRWVDLFRTAAGKAA